MNGHHLMVDALATSPPAKRRRVHTFGRWLFDHRADLLAALVYGCLAYLSFSALSEYANAHDLFPLPYGGWAFAVAIDGAVLYAFISFRRAPVLASMLLLSGAGTSFVLQHWHATGKHYPAVVAGVVPAAMVLVTFAWHRIRAVEDRSPWVIPTPTVPAPEEPTPTEPSGPDHPDLVPESRPRVAQGGVRRRGPATRGRPTAQAAQLAAQGQSAAQIARDLGLSDRARKGWVADLVREHRPTPAQMGHRNGDGGS